MSGRAIAPAAKAPVPGLSQAPAVVFQRKCACGQHTMGGECEECKQKHATLQRKSIGDRIVSVPLIVNDVLRTPGQPLDDAAREYMEPRFGHDFSKVRVHTDTQAAESARAVNAHAYTVGTDVVFGAGQYDLHSPEKQRLLAHELAHTVQQSRDLLNAAPGPDHEHEADAAAEAVTSRGVAVTIHVPSGVGVACKTDKEGGSPPSRELTEQDARSCSPLYLQKLCVYIEGGFNGDRSGVESAEDMARYNNVCRAESGYEEAPVNLSDKEKVALRSPNCSRGDPESARKRVRAARIAGALNRSTKYMPGAIGEQLVTIVNDPIFLGSLALAVGVYLALWLAPEPVFTKIAAAATTIAILSTGVFSISTLLNLARAWMDLDFEAGAAQSDEEIERAAERFGKRIGAVEADLLVFLASLLVGGRIPGPKRLPPVSRALAEAESALSSARPGGVVIEGPWGRARALPQSGDGPTGIIRGNTALKIETAPRPVQPAEVIPLPEPKGLPKPAAGEARLPATRPIPVVPVVPRVGSNPDNGDEKKDRPPFVLSLPRQKAPHLERYRSWLGALQSDPKFERGNPPQLESWHRVLRIGGSDAIPSSVYERGHKLGFTGESGERRIRVPDWSHSARKSIQMQVDHIIELQVTPAPMREEFDSMFNWELLDAESNRASGNLLKNNIAHERAKQVAFDPSAKDRVLVFDEVNLDGGTPGDRWSSEEIRAGEQLDAFEKYK